MIYLSAGHSTVDPGAVAFGRKEADIVVELRNIVAFYLLREGFPFEADGKGTENMPLAQTVRQAAHHHPALEFHCNAGPPSARGVETLSADKDMGLGEMLCDVIAHVLGTKNRGAKSESSGQHHRLAFVQAGGIIVELFFITNREDLAAYDAKKWLLGKAIAETLMMVR
jgi:N-acetylmuramoyl-L-alanine amidase